MRALRIRMTWRAFTLSSGLRGGAAGAGPPRSGWLFFRGRPGVFPQSSSCTLSIPSRGISSGGARAVPSPREACSAATAPTPGRRLRRGTRSSATFSELRPRARLGRLGREPLHPASPAAPAIARASVATTAPSASRAACSAFASHHPLAAQLERVLEHLDPALLARARRARAVEPFARAAPSRPCSRTSAISRRSSSLHGASKWAVHLPTFGDAPRAAARRERRRRARGGGGGAGSSCSSRSWSVCCSAGWWARRGREAT